MSPLKSRRLILRLAYARCAHERGVGKRPCSQCFRIALERHVTRADPTLLRDEVERRVDNWVLAVNPRETSVPLAS